MKQLCFLICIIACMLQAQQKVSGVSVFSACSKGSSRFQIQDDFFDDVKAVHEILPDRFSLRSKMNQVILAQENTDAQLFKSVSDFFAHSDSNEFQLYQFVGPWRSIPGRDDQFFLTDFADSITSNYLYNLLSFLPARYGLCVILSPKQFPFSTKLLQGITLPSLNLPAGKYFLHLQYSPDESFEDAVALYKKAWKKVALEKGGALAQGYISVSEFYEAFNLKLKELELKPTFYRVSSAPDIVIAKED